MAEALALTVAAVALAFLAVIAVARPRRRRRAPSPPGYGEVMMRTLGTLGDAAQKREYLRSGIHIGRTERCLCRTYALPFPGTRVITNDLVHERGLCQPVREAIGL